MPVEKVYVVAKLDRLKQYMDDARDILNMSDDDIIRSSVNLAALERYFQLLVDQAIDINHHFLKEGGQKVPDDMQSTFISLGESGLFPKDFSIKIAPSVGLRNRIVHQYDDVKPSVFVRTVRNNLADYDAYIKYILEQLK